ncbi:MAG: helix-turn-helix transcriptional regulator [Phascolarctobacterium sp.]|nr:helix-turn-helix transcriptional regulator [Phascolarctobacterium sp.]
MNDGSKFKDFFAERIYQLRDERNISARELSLIMGQNSSYINRIENKLTLPSMQGFFCICECLDITPQEFFHTEAVPSYTIRSTIKMLNQLDEQELEAINHLLMVMLKNKNTTVE